VYNCLVVGTVLLIKQLSISRSLWFKISPICQIICHACEAPVILKNGVFVNVLKSTQFKTIICFVIIFRTSFVQGHVAISRPAKATVDPFNIQNGVHVESFGRQIYICYLLYLKNYFNNCWRRFVVEPNVCHIANSVKIVPHFVVCIIPRFVI